MAMDSKTQKTAGGALAGAGTGAMIGSVVPGIGTLIGAGIGAVAGGLLGYLGPDDGTEERQKAVAAIEAIGNLEFDPADLTPDQLGAIQKYAPKIYESIGIDYPEKIQESSIARDAQMQALEQLGARTKQRGLSLQEKANLEQANQNVLRQNRSQTEAIQSNYGNRGMGGGTMELAQVLNNQRAGANTASDQALKAAGDAETRALQDLMNYGQMAGQVRGQDFNINSANTDTKNRFALTKFNNLQNVANQNTATANQAQQFNIANDVDRAKTNLQQSNQGKVWRTTAAQQKYEAATNKQKALANAYNGVASANDANAAAWQNTISGTMNMGAGMAKNQQDQNNFDSYMDYLNKKG